ncbi:hypothetical protein SLE2022_355650 [Rubroshorea leprosula]
MDTDDVTHVLFTKIRSIDPDNATKIMGYILIQDPPERELMRLALGPDSLLRTLVLKAKTDLGLSSNTLSSPSAPSPHSPLNPISRPTNSAVQNPFSQSSSRIARNGLGDYGKVTPLSPSSGPKSSHFLSHESTLSGSGSGSVLAPSFSHLNNGNDGGEGGNGGDFLDNHQLNEYLSFLDENSSKSEEFVDPRRSFSASELRLESEDVGFGGGYKPCIYFARGHCKNGDNCKFAHGGFADNVDHGGHIVGSSSKMDFLYHQLEEMKRMKALYQQRLAASQFVGGAPSLFSDKSMNLFLRQQNDPQRAAALMLGEEIYKFGQDQLERNDLFALALAEKANSASRQIYLTFPADSSFKDEDVSNYFSLFGPVQDVRIPYQQKRMFGFVTFVHAETVKFILERGNPHFICDSRVLVKPYKEKGKAPDKRQNLQQQFEVGNYSPSSSPSGLDFREMHELHLGEKMMYSPQEMILRRKYKEQADLQHAIEQQSRRFINLQLPDFKSDYTHHRSLSVGSSVSLPAHLVNQNAYLSLDSISQEIAEVNGDKTAGDVTSTINAPQELQPQTHSVCIQNSGDDNKKGSHTPEWCQAPELNPESRVEQVLPDGLSGSAMKSAVDQRPEISLLAEVNANIELKATSSSSENNPSLPTTSTSDMGSPQPSCS